MHVKKVLPSHCSHFNYLDCGENKWTDVRRTHATRGERVLRVSSVCAYFSRSFFLRRDERLLAVYKLNATSSSRLQLSRGNWDIDWFDRHNSTMITEVVVFHGDIESRSAHIFTTASHRLSCMTKNVFCLFVCFFMWISVLNWVCFSLFPGTFGYVGASAFVKKIYSTVKID